MKNERALRIALAIPILTACSWGELRTVDKPSTNFYAIGYVVDRAPVTIKGDESAAARITLGTLSAEMIGGVAGVVTGVAISVTEPGFTKPTAWLYHVKEPDGEHITLVSRSIVEAGDCASIKKYTDNELPILRHEDPSKCGRPGS